VHLLFPHIQDWRWNAAGETLQHSDSIYHPCVRQISDPILNCLKCVWITKYIFISFKYLFIYMYVFSMSFGNRCPLSVSGCLFEWRTFNVAVSYSLLHWCITLSCALTLLLRHSYKIINGLTQILAIRINFSQTIGIKYYCTLLFYHKVCLHITTHTHDFVTV
jgi:hypothetical protein